MKRVAVTAYQDPQRMARESQDNLDDLVDSWTEPSITILLEGEEAENDVFEDASAPSSTHLSKKKKLQLLDWVFSWGHPYGGHGIMKQGVFKVYPVSSPQAHY